MALFDLGAQFRAASSWLSGVPAAANLSNDVKLEVAPNTRAFTCTADMYNQAVRTLQIHQYLIRAVSKKDAPKAR